MSTKLRRAALGCASAAALVLALAPSAFAATAATAAGAMTTAGADQPPSSTTSAGAEGATVDTVIVTAERQVGARSAPTKASLEQTQPESIISHEFIEAVTPDVGNISTVVFIAPSISGISGNAGGIGNYFSTTMRGFPDGFYNVTYDGIAFGDTNNPTHHPNDYFPVSTIGAAVVDRGPGAAGDLGQANYGGAIHYFSPTLTDTPNALQKFTYGSFNTFDSVTTLNSGSISQLGGAKFWLDLDERSSDTELSHSGGNAYNQSAKFVLPVNDKVSVSGFFEHEWSRYNFPDSNGPGETLGQIQAYGKDFQLTNIPGEEHWTGYNYERKQTYFTYLDVKYQATSTITLEDQPYYYFYSNKTFSTDSNADLIGQNTSSQPAAKGANPKDIGGYFKRNDYQVFGDIIRIADQLPFGLLKVGGLVEGSSTFRERAFYDFTTGLPDNQYTPGGKNPLLTVTTNCKTCEHSHWLQEQFFIDVDWTPLENLKISPGFKYVNFRRSIDATEDSLGKPFGVAPVNGDNTYNSPLYFLTANYKLTPYMSVYGQYATSFLIPQLADLQVPGVTLQNLKPGTTINYQTGVVYSRGPATWDADLYAIFARNVDVPCQIPTGVGALTETGTCNSGQVHYSGFEGQGAYLLPFGLTAFVNGSINNARQLAEGPNTIGIATHPGQPLASVPAFTAAGGLLYHRGPWQASLTYKEVGPQWVNGAGTTSGQIKVPSYNTINGDVAYRFMERFQVKLQVFNLLDKRALTNYVAEGNETALYQSQAKTSFYTFQSGREIDGTISAKF